MGNIFDQTAIRTSDNFRTPTAKEFGERLKKMRKNKHLTQEQLAGIANITLRSYQKNEAGETWMSTETFLKIMLALDNVIIASFYKWKI